MEENGCTQDGRTVSGALLTGERAEFFAQDAHYDGCIFADGESPLKHARNVTLDSCMFRWKYPLWYVTGATVRNSVWLEMARAGVWYSTDISLADCTVDAPKNFRRCRNLSLSHVHLPNAEETLWQCEHVRLSDVQAKGNYFAMNSSNLEIDGLELSGNYPFDGCRDVTISNSRLLSKDCFWNCENVTIRDSFISGEYFGWNSRNVTLENCTVESLQGFCYIDSLVMKNCRLLNTTLAFEYSTVEADIRGSIDSVLNPSGGTIRADRIASLVIEKDRVDPSKTRIVCTDVNGGGTGQ